MIRRLIDSGYKLVSRLTIPGFLLQSPEGAEVDVLFGDMPWIDGALQQPQQDPPGYPVLGLPYLVLMKLGAMRAQDWADVSRMLGLASDDQLDKVREIVARYTPEDSGDLESLIFIGKKERELPPSVE